MPKHFVTPANRVCYCPQCAPAWRAWGKVMRAMAQRMERERTGQPQRLPDKAAEARELAEWLDQDVH